MGLHHRSVKPFVLVAVLLFAAPFAAQPQEPDVIANGVFLVAQPSLTEPTFQRTVILITQPPRMGPLGVIINRRTGTPLSEIYPKHQQLAAQQQPLHFGGPVQPQGVLFLVRAETPPPRALRVLQDVYLMSDADWVNGALDDDNALSAVRAYAGYSAWAPGQLRNELARQGWYILPADSTTIFDKNPDEIWAELFKRAVLRPAHEIILNKNNRLHIISKSAIAAGSSRPDMR